LGYSAGLGRCLGNQAPILRARGDPDGALALNKEAERLFRQVDDPAGLQASLGNQAPILQDRGDKEAVDEPGERVGSLPIERLGGRPKRCLRSTTRV
jgi:ATP/maltotriose-dependent transcriptional regulator MalT